MKAFLKPLSISQEKYYLQKYQEGDSQAKNILIEHNLRLVAHVVKKYQGTGEDTDDLQLLLLIRRKLRDYLRTLPGV